MWNRLNATETGERGVKLAEEERDTSGAGFYKIKHIIGASWTRPIGLKYIWSTMYTRMRNKVFKMEMLPTLILDRLVVFLLIDWC